MIPLCRPAVDEQEINAVKEVLESGWLAHGPRNKEFESELAKYVGTKRAVTVNSCTSALHLAIQGSGIEQGDEVIVPSFTIGASANPILYVGAKPVFVDVDFQTCNIDPEKIEEAITDKTKAIMPIHYAGLSCDMGRIMEIAQKHNLIIVEDSAETIGATFDGKKTGSFGIGCFSFYATKNLTTGEGGALTTDSDELAQKVLTMRGHGISKGAFERGKERKPWTRIQTMVGYNYRMTDFQAAMGLVQLRKLDKMNESRRKHAKYLTKRLSSIDGIETPVEPKKHKHVYQMYTIKVDGDRDKFVLKLREKGVEASVHFDPPVHLNTFFMDRLGFKGGEFPVTEKLSKQIATLPMFPQLTKEELDTIVNCVEEAKK